MAATSEGQRSQTELRPFYEQEPFLGTDKRYYGYVSGVGAGKTFAGIVRTALNMEEWNPGEMGAIVAPTTTMVKDVILSEMRDLGLLDHWEYKSSYSDEPGLHAPNGSRALILSADNQRTIERLRGLNLAWWWMDEEAIIDPRAREILMQRIRTGNYRNGYITTTPKGKNHTYDFFAGDVEYDIREHGAGRLYDADDRLAIVGVPTSANPHTPEDYKRSVETDLPEDLVAQEVKGEFVEVGAGLLTRDMLEFVPSADLPDRPLSWYVGVDLGVTADPGDAKEHDSDYWAAALVAYDAQGNTAYLVDVKRQRGLSLQEGVGWLARLLEDVPTTRVLAEANQAQRWFVQTARDAGLNVDPVQNTESKEERITYMSIPFESGRAKLVERESVDWSDFVAEWTAFPEGAHDDMLDAVEIALQSIDLGSGIKAHMGQAYGDR